MIHLQELARSFLEQIQLRFILSRTGRNQNVGWIKRVARIHQSAWTIHWWKRYAFSTLHKSTWKATPVLDLRYILVTNCEDLTDKRLNFSVGGVVGANSFARSMSYVRINSHLQKRHNPLKYHNVLR